MNSAARYLQGVSTTRRRRPALIALVIVAACGCLALGWWQWTRFQSVSGTFQNLGYALQWPLFAWFCVYAYRKFVRYEETPPEPRTKSVCHRDTCRTAARASEARASNRPTIPRYGSTTTTWPSSRRTMPIEQNRTTA